MKVFDAKHIKNVVLLGSSKSGKTTLAETMLFEAGLINRRGKVEDKNTVSDIMKSNTNERTLYMQLFYIQNGGITKSISLIHRALMILWVR